MLTYIVMSKTSSIFIIDEPDIYLHSDLQRQLISILKALGPDILIATHSTEIITEADPGDLLVINKKLRSGQRIKDPTDIQKVFQTLGSNLNPLLTQLAKMRRALYVEGNDYKIISGFARKLNFKQIANRSDYAVIPTEGFNPNKVSDFTDGIEKTLGTGVLTAVVFDRDYRCNEECQEEINSLNKTCSFSHIHDRKEIENFLLVIDPIRRAIERKIDEQNKRTRSNNTFKEDLDALIMKMTDSLRNKTESRYLIKQRNFLKRKSPHIDDTTIDEELMNEFDKKWQDIDQRMLIVPGKTVLAELNKHLQDNYGITLTARMIIESFNMNEIPKEMIYIIEKLEEFRNQEVK